MRLHAVRRARVAALGTIVVLLSHSPLAAQLPDTSSSQRWRADLAFLARELPTRHKDFFHSLPRERFDSAVAELDRRIPELDDAGVMLNLSRLVASAGDGHTSVRLNAAARIMHAFPIGTFWFGDGIHVIQAAPEQQAIAGAKLIAIDDVPVDDVAARLATFIAHDNQATVRQQVPQLMVVAEALHTAGVIASRERARFTVETETGRQTVELAAVPLIARPELRGPGAPERPLYLSDTGTSYWFRLLEDGTLYFQYNRCVDDPARPIAAFTEELLAQLNDARVRRVVVDLRHNGGGNSMLLRPFVDGLKAWLDAAGGRRVYALTSRRTFSSAVINAHELRQLGAVIAGQPTGGRPNHFGEVRTFQLPNSGLAVSYSTKYFRLLPDEDPESIMPDLPVEVMAADAFAGRDPVLARVLAES